MKEKPDRKKIPPPPNYPDMLHFRVLTAGQNLYMEVSKKHAEAPDPFGVVTLGMLHRGQVKITRK